jgi:hypothetical protein
MKGTTAQAGNWRDVLCTGDHKWLTSNLPVWLAKVSSAWERGRRTRPPEVRGAVPQTATTRTLNC